MKKVKNAKLKVKSFSGFTLVEMLVVLGIIAVLTGLGTINLIGAKRSADVSASVNVLIADLKSQQARAMSGDTESGAVIDDYGVYFSSGEYTLFRGSDFAGSDPGSHFVVEPSDGIVFSSIDLQNSQVVFEKGSGEFLNYSSTENSTTLSDPAGNEKTVLINSYGVVTDVN